jgi:hypothetical protein
MTARNNCFVMALIAFVAWSLGGDPWDIAGPYAVGCMFAYGFLGVRSDGVRVSS